MSRTHSARGGGFTVHCGYQFSYTSINFYTTDNSFVPPIYQNHSPIVYVHKVVGALLGILNRAMPILHDGLEPQLSLH